MHKVLPPFLLVILQDCKVLFPTKYCKFMYCHSKLFTSQKYSARGLSERSLGSNDIQ